MKSKQQSVMHGQFCVCCITNFLEVKKGTYIAPEDNCTAETNIALFPAYLEIIEAEKLICIVFNMD